jgi:hypothetical protein
VAGNVLRLAIPLTLRVVDSSGGTPVTTDSDFIPNSAYPVEVVLSRGAMEYSYQADMDGNVASMEDLGELEPGTYSITVLCRNDDGEPMRFKQRQVIQVVDATAEAGIESGVEYQAETHCLNAAIFWSTSGWASGTLPGGIVIDPDYVHTDNNFTDEYKEMLEGGTETTTQTYTSDALTIGTVYKPQDIGDNNPVTANSWRSGIFPAQPGDVITLTTDGHGVSFPALIYYNGNTYISHIAQNVYGELDVIRNAVAPAGTTRIVVNCYRANDPSFSLEISRTTTTGGLYQRVSTLESSVSTLQDGMDSVEALPDIVEELQQDMSRLGGQTTTDYTRDDLIYGKCVYPRDLAQDNPSTLGSAWYYGFFQVQRGDVVTLVTDGYGDSIPPLLAFNGDTYVSSIEGNNYNVVDDEITYTVPAGVTQIAVNCHRGQISKFAMSISSLTGILGRVSSLEDSTESLEDRVGALEGTTDPELKERVDVLEGNIATPSTVTRKVLVIGNSYSYDAFTYLPAVVSEAEPDLSSDWVVGICMDGSQTLEGHYTNHAVNGTTFTRYSKISSAAAYGAWTTDYGATLTAALEDEDWDLIVFHQASNLACDYSSIETPLANLIAWFKAQGYTGKFGWMIVPSFPDGTVQYTKTDNTVVTTNKLAVVSQSLGLDHTMTSDEMESRIMDVAHRVQRNNTDISVVLPAGVALQMARKSALNRFGECVTLEGNMPQLMYKDGHHLEMGIANLTESWAIALTLLNGMVAMADIDTPRWPHGDRMSSDGQPVGLDSESQALARQCARQALDYYWRCDNSESQQSGGGSSVTIDSTPTAGSGNAVSSGGVYTALAGKADSSHTHAIADVTGLQSALNAKQDALTSQTALGEVNGQTLNYGGAVALTGEDIPLSSGSSTNVKNAIALINNNLAGKQDTLSFGTGLDLNGNEVSVNTASSISSGETGYTTGGQVYSALAGKQNTIAKGSVTIATSDWSSNAVTVTATGVTASNTVIVSPDSASMADYAAAGVQCTAQGANTLTFSCTSAPTSSLTINYIAI